VPHDKLTPSSRGMTPLKRASAHEWVEGVTAVLEANPVADLQEKRRILKSRAVALAKEAGDGKQAGECIETVEFLLACEHYAIESRHVREVFSLRDLTPLPCTPPYILGMTNLRGQILSIFDLKRFFEISAKGLTQFNKVLLVQTDEMEIGILADEILGMKTVPLEDIHPPPATFAGVHAEYVRGVTRNRLVVLDIGKMLADKRIVVHEEVDV
jgi:purine-binding chemotaxis protein CheW